MDRRDLVIAGAALGAGAGLALLFRRLTAYKPPKVWQPKDMGGKFGSINRPTAGARTQKALPKGKHPIQLYSLATPNGVKITTMLEELVDLLPDFEYDAFTVSIMAGDQFTSGFVGVNPNSKIPAMVDQSDPRAPVNIFESGSILIYLADKYDTEGKFLPKDPAKRSQVISWLMWQMGSAPYLGGGFGHFYNYAPVKIEYAVDRFTMEAKRQLDVLNNQLADGRPFICGDQYTIADIAIYPWYGVLVEGDLYGDARTFLDAEASYPHVIAWAKRISSRSTVQRGKMVNRTWGPKEKQLHERHSRTDFETKTQDKLNP